MRRRLRQVFRGPRGDSRRHLPREELERGFAALEPPPVDRGRVALIVARAESGAHETPERVTLTPESGVPGDAWQRDIPDRLDSQVTAIRADVARLVANGQALSLSGDNLVLDLELSFANLPAGGQLRAGQALLEVTPEPHTGCVKFRQRFGGDALRLTANPRLRELRLRGIYFVVVEAGEVVVGDPIAVLSRAAPAA